jgi:hypothetical protein
MEWRGIRKAINLRERYLACMHMEYRMHAQMQCSANKSLDKRTNRCYTMSDGDKALVASIVTFVTILLFPWFVRYFFWVLG